MIFILEISETIVTCQQLPLDSLLFKAINYSLHQFNKPDDSVQNYNILFMISVDLHSITQKISNIISWRNFRLFFRIVYMSDINLTNKLSLNVYFVLFNDVIIAIFSYFYTSAAY